MTSKEVYKTFFTQKKKKITEQILQEILIDIL